MVPEPLRRLHCKTSRESLSFPIPLYSIYGGRHELTAGTKCMYEVPLVDRVLRCLYACDQQCMQYSSFLHSRITKCNALPTVSANV